MEVQCKRIRRSRISEKSKIKSLLVQLVTVIKRQVGR
jgi:hypothetical protein